MVFKLEFCFIKRYNSQQNSNLKTGENVYIMQERKFLLLIFNTRNLFPVHPFTINLRAQGIYSFLTALFPLSCFKA